ncbi:uncharacterized protein L3040_008502 [Drepanopeziza brunnea f. sp. 'multigermtubi']|uniref:Hydrophobin n=1 Tax=Marssonina brunnea f. sp. multigermtubi (strain MB_m1) TaxID=1072389 RepID=K1WVA9_MARBU|nr:uncharacterized protein MBM_05696 [Drepanopeziza brunnea f. sp. 'multigermtubi' MB_m1]EKD16402.1 hypothetical protein MBM_05696 [Drepanopeziza brunnea f. sp. 'multigermtubi' MB_m1]KAJ5033385.1 hypothetical protein L3040_008502 [Drepanopeziza brunnea f. sp. 'multigermtubi']
MQFTTALTVVFLAATTLAAPTALEALEARTGGGSCNNSQQQVCCTGGGILNLSCLVGVIPILSPACSGGSYCCSNAGSSGGLVNINALNCVKVG